MSFAQPECDSSLGLSFSYEEAGDGQGTVSFSALISDPNNTGLLSIAWVIGDMIITGDPNIEPGLLNPTVNLDQGLYNICVSIHDNSGCYVQYCEEIYLCGVGSSWDAPSFTSTQGSNPRFYTFNATAGFTSPPQPGSSVVSYSWDFGSGATGSGQQDTHLFPSSGTYEVCLTTIDNFGCTATVCEKLVVLDLCDFIPDPEFITGNVTWNTNRFVNRSIVVSPGATLTIENVGFVNLASQVRIYVERGARLNIINSTLGTECPDYWRGIEVYGNGSGPHPSPDQVINDTYPNTVNDHGVVFMDNSTIMRAVTAVCAEVYDRNGLWITYDYISPTTDVWGEHWGGIIIAQNGSSFSNCRSRGIHIGGYPQDITLNRPNVSSFTDCTFNGFNSTKRGITHWRTQGTTVSRCQFNGLVQGGVSGSDYYGVVDGNEFNLPNADYAVLATYSGTVPRFDNLEISNNEITGPDAGIDVADGQQTIISQNVIIQVKNEGVYLQGASDFDVLGNLFFSSETGLRITSTVGFDQNLASCNFFNGSTEDGILAEFNNINFEFNDNVFNNPLSNNVRLAGQFRGAGEIFPNQGSFANAALNEFIGDRNIISPINNRRRPTRNFNYFSPKPDNSCGPRLVPLCPENSAFVNPCPVSDRQNFDLHLGAVPLVRFSCVSCVPNGEFDEPQEPCVTKDCFESFYPTYADAKAMAFDASATTMDSILYYDFLRLYAQSFMNVIDLFLDNGEVDEAIAYIDTYGEDWHKRLKLNIQKSYLQFSAARSTLAQFPLETEDDQDFVFLENVIIDALELQEDFEYTQYDTTRIRNLATEYSPYSGYAVSLIDQHLGEYVRLPRPIFDELEDRSAREMEENAIHLGIAPNPVLAGAELTVALPSEYSSTSTVNVKIFNMQGVVLSDSVISIEESIFSVQSPKESGLYFLLTSDLEGHSISVQKFVVQ